MNSLWDVNIQAFGFPSANRATMADKMTTMLQQVVVITNSSGYSFTAEVCSVGKTLKYEKTGVLMFRMDCLITWTISKTEMQRLEIARRKPPMIQSDCVER